MANLEPNRPLQAKATPRRRSLLGKLLVLVLLAVGLGLLIGQLDLRHDMRRLRIAVLSGDEAGNYHRLVESLAALAARERGTVKNVVSEGSADNLRKLSAAGERCDVAFALVQDGAVWPASKPTLIGRLPKAESVLFLGKHADTIHEFAQLRGLKIGVGPAGGGTALVAHSLFALPELARLGVTLSHHGLEEQLALAQSGALDLAMMVIDEDASLLTHAINRGLQLVGFQHADVIARRLPQLRTGRIGAGQYDAVTVLPREDKRVLRVDTLVLGNGCASRAETIDLLSLLSRRFPDFVRHNRDTPNTTGLELDDTAQGYVERGEPELADQYAPWAVAIMPPANWAYMVMAVSLLFNVMGIGHRFLLWRIDAGRVALESKLARAFGQATTVEELARAATDAQRVAVAAAVEAELEQLSARSRRYSLSLLVPMGEEMTYRYQEELIHQTLTALRAYQRRATTEA